MAARQSKSDNTGTWGLIIIAIIVINIIIFLVCDKYANDKLKETVNICAKEGLNSATCEMSSNKNNVVCEEDRIGIGASVKCKKKYNVPFIMLLPR